ncbi:MAG: FHA domain-containing protein [Planctomycetota bacterium]
MPATLRVVRGLELNSLYRLDDDDMCTMGRSVNCTVRVPDGLASRSHCEIQRRNGDWILTDVGSRNGTYVNKAQVNETTLHSGDLVRVGATVYKFSIDGEPDQQGLSGTEVLIDDLAEAESAQTEDTAEERDAEDIVKIAEDRAEPESAEPPKRTVCAQCGRELPDDAVEQDQATEIGGRLFCHRCVVPQVDVSESEELSAKDDAEPASSELEEDGSELESLLESLEAATEADQTEQPAPPEASPEPPPEPATEPPSEPEPEEPTKKPGLLDRLRGKKRGA